MLDASPGHLMPREQERVQFSGIPQPTHQCWWSLSAGSKAIELEFSGLCSHVYLLAAARTLTAPKDAEMQVVAISGKVGVRPMVIKRSQQAVKPLRRNSAECELNCEIEQRYDVMGVTCGDSPTRDSRIGISRGWVGLRSFGDFYGSFLTPFQQSHTDFERCRLNLKLGPIS